MLVELVGLVIVIVSVVMDVVVLFDMVLRQLVGLVVVSPCQLIGW